ncbi:MAG: disulfide bond formation protein B [Actinobacteria bacterium]|nr:disulfide bond formation protein B [Actinomycetota bacterium]MCO5299851.1 disulfide bond formation protein B [Candidatus Nanopelagicales bacterium]HPE13107.1 disulfide bond formation protein B [Actinomycetota bacterium]HPJ18634.1 disulfide bond formation protein B [Actinomycetota bacterium]HPQ83022.1 disulfide bond formation protein B [Actinomycetota bacterium]
MKSFPRLLFWAMHLWVLAYSGVMLGAFTIQFVGGEFPCPLCMLQRYGMILSTIGALWIIMQARRGELTAVRYAQGLGMGVLGAAAGALVSVRQILLHIKPGDPGYGEPVLGMHLYTWALITFYVVILFVAVVSMLAPVGIPEAPTRAGAQRTISTLIVGLFALVVAANVIAIIFLEGFAWVLPDDPTGYNLLDQLGL